MRRGGCRESVACRATRPPSQEHRSRTAFGSRRRASAGESAYRAVPSSAMSGRSARFVHREPTQSPTFLLSNAHVIVRPADLDAAIAEVDVATSQRIRDQATVLRGQRTSPTAESVAVYKVGAATERTDGAPGAELIDEVPVEFGPGDIRFSTISLKLLVATVTLLTAATAAHWSSIEMILLWVFLSQEAPSTAQSHMQSDARSARRITDRTGIAASSRTM